MVSFNPSKDIPSLQGKVILVTGGNIGLGRQSILEFSRHDPAQIWLAARNLDKARVTADEIKQHVPGAPIKLLELDLTSFESVKNAAKTFGEESDRLDILMCNAGIMMAPPGVTKEGYEIQFGTNHMGHALLTRLLLPVLEKTAARSDADVRVVSMSSYGHSSAPKEGMVFGSLQDTGRNDGVTRAVWTEQVGEYPLGKGAGQAISSIHGGRGTPGGGEYESSFGCNRCSILGQNVVRYDEKGGIHCVG
ncbi:hypothetical protein PV11_05326 [Exophiala sideris]|uniref:Oxidoreductase n=1 Tax=Exophiala sideris TaxID=1016849 RepID=A0A0D1Z944_9EURO|nr:hypothetical protein PV11_05326 [Exophiala sideris]